MSLINVSASGSDLAKTGGCDGCADAFATSEQTMSGTGVIEFTASETGSLRIVGLGSGGPGTAAGDIQFALRLQGGVVEVRESGAYRTETSFGAGDAFRIAVEGGVVSYSKNGAVFYTSSVPAASTLRLHAVLFNVGAAIANASFAGGTATSGVETPTKQQTLPAAGTGRFAVPRPAGSFPKRRR